MKEDGSKRRTKAASYDRRVKAEVAVAPTPIMEALVGSSVRRSWLGWWLVVQCIQFLQNRIDD